MVLGNEEPGTGIRKIGRRGLGGMSLLRFYRLPVSVSRFPISDSPSRKPARGART